MYDNNGRVRYSTDPEGNTTESVYDNTGNLIRSIGKETNYLYNGIRKQIQVTYPDGTITRTVYDVQGRVKASVDRYLPGNKTYGTITTYDLEGRVEKTSEQKKALKHRIAVYDEGQ